MSGMDLQELMIPAFNICRFVVLFLLYVVALEMNDPHKINVSEALFMVYALGRKASPVLQRLKT